MIAAQGRLRKGGGKVPSFSFFLTFWSRLSLSLFFSPSSILGMQLDPIYNPFSHLFELKSQIAVLSRLNVHGSQHVPSRFRSSWVSGLQDGKLRHVLEPQAEREKTDPNQNFLTSLLERDCSVLHMGCLPKTLIILNYLNWL